MSRKPGTVYLLHFDTPLGNARHMARHYVGWAKALDTRLADHAAGRGARITAYAAGAGIGWQVARTWRGSRQLERQVKRQHHHSRFCPVCRKHAAQEAAQ